MSGARCHFCRRTPVDPLPPGTLSAEDGTPLTACAGCFETFDLEDEQLGLEAGRWQFAPDELAALDEIRESPRKPPKRAEPDRLPARRSAA